MTPFRIATLALGLFAVIPARAETTGAALTQARDTTATGQTRPPSRAASPADRGDVNRRTRNDQEQDLVTKGICIGCSPK